MLEWKKILILLISVSIILIFALFSNSQVQDEFNNSLTSENLTFTGNQNITRYLRLRNDSELLNSTIKILGNVNNNYTYNPYLEIGTPDGIYEWHGYGYYINDYFYSNGSFEFNSSMRDFNFSGSDNINSSIILNKKINLTYASINITPKISFINTENISYATPHGIEYVNGKLYITSDGSGISIRYPNNGTEIETIVPDSTTSLSDIATNLTNGTITDFWVSDMNNNQAGQNRYKILHLNSSWNNDYNISLNDGIMSEMSGLAVSDDGNTFWYTKYSDTIYTINRNGIYSINYSISSFGTEGLDTHENGSTMWISSGISAGASDSELALIRLNSDGTTTFLQRFMVVSGGARESGIAIDNDTKSLFMTRSLTPALYHVINISSTYNVYLDICNDSQYEWSNNKTFLYNQSTGNFSQSLNNCLSSCNADSNNDCTIKFHFHSDQTGNYTISNLTLYFNYTEGIVIDKNYTNFNSTLESYLTTCVVDSNNYCDIPFIFHSDNGGILEYSSININYTLPPIITYSGSPNLSITLKANGINYYNITIQQETNDTITYRNFSVAINTTYFNTSFSIQQVNLTNSSNITTLNISVSGNILTGTYRGNISFLRAFDAKNYTFPLIITLVNQTAITSFFNNSGWVIADFSNANITRKFTLNNTGDYNLTDIEFKIFKGGGLGNLHTFMTHNVTSNINLINGTYIDVLVAISNPSAALYNNEFLNMEGIGTSTNDIITTSNSVELTFTISQAPISVSGGGGAVTKEKEVIDCNLSAFRIETVNKKSELDFSLIPKGSKTKQLFIYNDGLNLSKIKISCDSNDISCNYVTFSQIEFNVTPNPLNPSKFDLNVKAPIEEENKYFFNVIATDKDNCQRKVSINVEVGFNFFSIGTKTILLPFSKLGEGYNDKEIPALIPAFIIAVIYFALAQLIFSKLFKLTYFGVFFNLLISIGTIIGFVLVV